MKKNFLSIILLLYVVPVVLSQTIEEHVIVDSIAIKGNETTKDYIILRELTFEPGDGVDSTILDYNRERIYSLGLFSQVELDILSEQNQNILQIDVEESWYFYPLPFLEFEESNFQKATYGLFLLYKNFRGRNEEISSFFKLGYDPAFGINYYNPLITKESGLIGQIGASMGTIQNKSRTALTINKENLDYKVITVNAGLGKRLNLFNTIFLQVGYSYIDLPVNANKLLTASQSGTDKVLFSSMEYTFDSRDLKQFPKEGFFGLTNFTHKGFTIDNINYNILFVDLRNYYKVSKKLASKGRLAVRHTFGRYVPYYDYSFLGFSEIVRGYKDKEREGNNFLIGSFELRYPVISEWNLSFKLPLIPENLTSYRIAVFVKTFADAGVAFNNHQKFLLKDFDTGYGFGLTFLVLPYNAFRIEYAINDFGKGELLLGTGFSF